MTGATKDALPTIARMKPLALLVVVAAIPALLASPGGAVAQDNAAPAPAAVATSSKRTVVRLPVEEKPSALREKGEPNVQYTIIEDDSVRVDELKVRGQTQKITVTPKIGPSYEIITSDGSRDYSYGPKPARGAAGARVWSFFTF